MAAVMPQTRPWTIPPRGSSDGVKDRHAKISAPQQPGSVAYSSLRRFPGSVGPGPSAAAAAGGALTAAAGEGAAGGASTAAGGGASTATAGGASTATAGAAPAAAAGGA